MLKTRRLDGQKEYFFSNVLDSVVVYCSWFRKPNFCGSSDIVLFKQCQSNTQMTVWVFFGGGVGILRSQNTAYGT